jgi:hypothetical protein
VYDESGKKELLRFGVGKMRRTPWTYFLIAFVCTLTSYAQVEYNLGEHHIFSDIDDDIWIENIGGISNPVEVSLHNGSIYGNVTIFEGSPYVSSFKMLGGEILGHLVTENGTTAEIFDGAIAQRVGAFMQSKINIYGGDISYEIYANTGAEIHLWGTNFNYAYGEINDNTGTLTGTLKNGDMINCSFEKYIDPWETDPSFVPKIILHPIPEPATLLLVGIGAVLLKRKR